MARRRFSAPAPEQIRAAGLKQEKQDGKTGNEKFLKLLARTPRRENFRFFRVEQGGFALRAGEFVHFQLFEPLIFLEPHLEPACKGDERAEAKKN